VSLFLGVQGRAFLYVAPPTINAAVLDTTLNNRRNRSGSNVLRILGKEAQYNGYLTVKVIHKTNVERYSESGEIVFDDHQISFLAGHIPFAKKGGTFLIDGKTFTLKAPLDRSSVGMQTWIMV
jgi:hypothetical protein